jgi:protein-tyrosine phosphatase
MDVQSAAQLVARGGDPSGFRARDLTPALILESDLILTATRVHRGKVSLMAPKALRRVFTFRDFAHLLAGIDGLNLPAGDTSPQAWVRRVAEKAASSRGLRPPLAAGSADIIDPYRRQDEVFATMAEQIVESMPAVVRALIG